MSACPRAAAGSWRWSRSSTSSRAVRSTPVPPTSSSSTEEAPTLHVYVEDLVTECEHDEWLDPGFTEWCEAIEEVPGVRRPAP